jgi:excisionase family DNA binding protein
LIGMTLHGMTSPQVPQNYLRPKTIVAQYDVSERTVRRWIADGTVDSVRVGRNVFVSAESLRRLFKQAP